MPKHFDEAPDENAGLVFFVIGCVYILILIIVASVLP